MYSIMLNVCRIDVLGYIKTVLCITPHLTVFIMIIKIRFWLVQVLQITNVAITISNKFLNSDQRFLAVK